eukprot:289692-Alexandrium_andersonii.AAC.1
MRNRSVRSSLYPPPGTGILALQSAQSEVNNPPNARQCCNRPNLQSALPNMKHRFRRSNLDLRRPRNGLKVGLRSSRWA